MGDVQSSAESVTAHRHLMLGPEHWSLFEAWLRRQPDLTEQAAEIRQAQEQFALGHGPQVIGVPEDRWGSLAQWVADAGLALRLVPDEWTLSHPTGAPLYCLMPADAPAAGAMTDADFAALAEQVVGVQQRHRYVAATAEQLPVLATWARRHPDLTEVRHVLEAIEYASADWSFEEGGPTAAARNEGVSLIRISAQWEDLQTWAREQGWRVLKIPDAVRQSPVEGGITGPVYLLERRPAGPPSAPHTDW